MPASRLGRRKMLGAAGAVVAFCAASSCHAAHCQSATPRVAWYSGGLGTDLWNTWAPRPSSRAEVRVRKILAGRAFTGMADGWGCTCYRAVAEGRTQTCDHLSWGRPVRSVSRAVGVERGGGRWLVDLRRVPLAVYTDA